MNFVVKGGEKYLDGVELKFSDFLLKDNLQIWGNKPMMRNLVTSLKKRTNNESMDLLLAFSQGIAWWLSAYCSTV